MFVEVFANYFRDGIQVCLHKVDIKMIYIFGYRDCYPKRDHYFLFRLIENITEVG
jgi:hypothetical protein